MRNSRSLYQPHNNRPGFTGHKRIHIFSIPSCLGNNHFCFLLVESLPKLLVFQIDLDILVLGIVNRHMDLLWRSRHGTWSEVRWLFRHLCRMVRWIWKRPVWIQIIRNRRPTPWYARNKLRTTFQQRTDAKISHPCWVEWIVSHYRTYVCRSLVRCSRLFSSHSRSPLNSCIVYEVLFQLRRNNVVVIRTNEPDSLIGREFSNNQSGRATLILDMCNWHAIHWGGDIFVFFSERISTFSMFLVTYSNVSQ